MDVTRPDLPATQGTPLAPALRDAGAVDPAGRQARAFPGRPEKRVHGFEVVVRRSALNDV